MQFILGFGYQFVSVVLIAVALSLFLYFISTRNGRGVIWSVFATWCCIGLLAAIYAHRHYFPEGQVESAQTSQPASRDDVEEIKKQLAQLYEHLTPPPKEVTDKYHGVSLHSVLSLHPLSEPRRKYLFDLGRIDRERLSIYFDPDNVLTLALISSSNEPYSVRIAPQDVPLDHFIYLSCEVAVKTNSTSLRILINGKVVGSQDLPFAVSPNRIEPTGAVIGADLNGQNGAKFDLAESVLLSQTLTSHELKDLLQHFADNKQRQCVRFSGSQWLRNQGQGKGFHQSIPEAMPTIKKLDQ